MKLKEHEITFQFYENRVWNACRVHASDCPFCNDGRGIHPDADGSTGRWSEKFATLDDALSAANKTGRKVLECKRCLHMNLKNVIKVAV